MWDIRYYMPRERRSGNDDNNFCVDNFKKIDFIEAPVSHQLLFLLCNYALPRG